MTKIQKVWLWISGAMFLVPEILFLFTPLSILSLINNFSEININPPIYYIITSQFFIDNPTYLFIALFAELLGVLGLLITSIKLKKKTFSILLGVIILWLSFMIFVGYILSNMNFIF